MEEKKARVVTKIGDIFCVEIDDKYKTFFQYICNDSSQLSSPVVRVFKRFYSLNSMPSIDEIVNDEVSFYVHTFIRVGMHLGIWYKVGKCKDVGDTSNIFFKIYSDVNFGLTGQTKSYNWSVWRINCKWEFLGEMKDEFRDYNMGFIYSYQNIVEKIKTGKFLSVTLE